MRRARRESIVCSDHGSCPLEASVQPQPPAGTRVPRPLSYQRSASSAVGTLLADSTDSLAPPCLFICCGRACFRCPWLRLHLSGPRHFLSTYLGVGVHTMPFGTSPLATRPSWTHFSPSATCSAFNRREIAILSFSIRKRSPLRKRQAQGIQPSTSQVRTQRHCPMTSSRYRSIEVLHSNHCGAADSVWYSSIFSGGKRSLPQARLSMLRFPSRQITFMSAPLASNSRYQVPSTCEIVSQDRHSWLRYHT